MKTNSKTCYITDVMRHHAAVPPSICSFLIAFPNILGQARVFQSVFLLDEKLKKFNGSIITADNIKPNMHLSRRKSKKNKNII